MPRGQQELIKERDLLKDMELKPIPLAYVPLDALGYTVPVE
jgi:hypothetical protein